ncbi:hypothetical protein C8R44DRAFT_864586 [Mycena epipterygia]|nr:hypothetical protein C8R44DRAFT_864586 [Mycena epipterygia]
MSFVLATGLAEAVVEFTLYGAFTVVFFAVVYLFWTRGLISTKRPSLFVFVALVLLFLSITAHWINGIYVVYIAFIRLGGGIPAELFYLGLSSPTSLAHISLVEIATFITDALVIHRLYIVWSCQIRVIIIPVIFQLAQVVSGIHTIYDFSRETLFTFYALSNPWVTTSLVSSLVISAYSNGMIIYKIWGMARSVQRITGKPNSGQRLMAVLAVILESSVLQTTMSVCILVSFQIGLLVQSVFTALQPVVFGLSVLLIHARVGLGWAQESYRANSTSLPTAISLNINVTRTTRADGTVVESMIGSRGNGSVGAGMKKQEDVLSISEV